MEMLKCVSLRDKICIMRKKEWCSVEVVIAHPKEYESVSETSHYLRQCYLDCLNAGSPQDLKFLKAQSQTTLKNKKPRKRKKKELKDSGKYLCYVPGVFLVKMPRDFPLNL